MGGFSALLLLATLAALAYLLVAIAVTLRFSGRQLPAAAAPLPSVTVLKAVSGVENALHENLGSFCEQEYPDFQVLFCVHRDDDPAIAEIERVIEAHPQCDARLLVGNDPAQRNPKIANLTKSVALTRGEIVVVADSDVRVTPHYLSALVGSFTDPKAGAATCLYRAMALPSPIGQLGAAYVEDQFAPSVLVAATLGTLRFCLGATMAVRRRVLDEIGGLAALGPYLADDHKLGELVSARGHRVALSRYVVATAIAETTLSALWSHELRWARTSFTLAPIGYLFSFLMFPLPLALLYLGISSNLAIGTAVVAAALGLRVALHYTARSALGSTCDSPVWLIPVRDLLSFALWFVSIFGRTVRWRDDETSVDGQGRMR